MSFCVFLYILVFTIPPLFADTSSNTDFNPFPQMEQDQKNTETQAVVTNQQQNDDWPPANSDTQVNSDGTHE